MCCCRAPDEWSKLAAWICDNELFCPNVRWLIQVPRLYSVYKSSGSINSFEDILRSTLRTRTKQLGRACAEAHPLAFGQRHFCARHQICSSRSTRSR